MFEKVKQKIGGFVEENRRRREEEARLERERIQAEKDALMVLNEKELMVEAIMALKGYNIRIAKIEETQDDLTNMVDSLASDVSSLKSDKSY